MTAHKKQSTLENLTIVVNTCDAYSDVLSLFFAAFNEYWPGCEFPVVINTESNSYLNYPARSQNFKSKDGSDQWGARLRSTLQSIETEFVIMLYDDFILEAPVDLLGLKSAISLLLEDDTASVVYITQTSLPFDSRGNNHQFSTVIDGSDYKLNSAPGVWRREELLKYTGVNDNPWAWEVFGSYRTYGDGKFFFTPRASMCDIYPYNYTRGGAIYRGKWVRKVVEDKIRKYNLDIDTSVRGFCEDQKPESRSFKWKIGFMMVGFKMVGFKSFLFIFRYMRAKLSEKSS
jgi:hypothetical protein